MKFSLSAVALSTLALLTAPLSAQSCSDLTVTGDGSPGTALVFSIAGAPADAPTAVLAGFGGTGSFPPGMSFIDLGILPPFFPLGAGMTDANGDYSLTIDVPAMLRGYIQGHAQGISVEFTLPGRPGGRPAFPITLCTSDVEAFSAGTPPTT